MAKYALALLSALASAPAWAGGVVATPALDPPASGAIHCHVSNVSDKKAIEVEWGIYDYNGSADFGPVTSLLAPLSNIRSGTPVAQQAACVARVVKGSKSSVRVALTAVDSGGNVVAAVEGR